MAKVKIYDTTLRDGTQGEGVSLSVEDKLKIAARLDKLGVHYIEGGWPGSNPKDMDFFRRVGELRLTNAKVTAFGSTRRPGIKAEEDPSILALLDSGVEVATIFGKSWDFHVTHALKTTLEENIAMIRDSVSFLKSKGLELIYDAEHFFDAYKSNSEYTMATLLAAQEAGADTIVLCDTNGGTMCHEISFMVQKVMEVLKVPVGIHVHNDCDLAVANTLIGVQAGVTHVQGTFNGYGERCGNANLCSIIPNLVFKMGIDCIPIGKLEGLTETSRYVSEIANLNHPSNQPYVGNSAFAHKGGVHVSALLKNPSTYEHLQPELVGNKRRVLVSELSGMSNMLYKAQELDLDIDLKNTTEETKKVLEEIKELEYHGFQFEGAEASFELLIRKAFGGTPEIFKLQACRIIMEMRENNRVDCEAIIKVDVGGEIVHTAAEGNGPVNALDNALRKALQEFYPDIKSMHLTDYKVRVLDEKDGTAADVRVLIETKSGQKTWGTVGVSGNIIEASWQALVDSISYGVIKGTK